MRKLIFLFLSLLIVMCSITGVFAANKVVTQEVVDSAVNWAIGIKNNYKNDYYNKKNGWSMCAEFVYDAYKKGTENITSFDSSGIKSNDAWAMGKTMKLTKKGTPPKGSLVFWSDGDAPGHVGLIIDNKGTMLNIQQYGGRRWNDTVCKKEHYTDYTSYVDQTYEGWGFWPGYTFPPTPTPPTPKKVEKITLSGGSTVEIGKTLTLTAKVSPTDAANKKVNWKSSDTSIATVSSSGVVKGIKKGTVTITATAADGSGKKGTLKVTVKPIQVSSVTIKIPDSHFIDQGEELQLSATVSPSNAADKTLRWYSQDTSIATVSASGLVTGVNPGPVVIYAEAKDGSGQYDFALVWVKQVESSEKPVEISKISFPNDNEWGVEVGRSIPLHVEITPEDATNKTLRWSSEDTSVATVDSNGVVTGVSEIGKNRLGITTILAEATDGSGKRAEWYVAVIPVYVEDITITGPASIVVGDTVTLSASVSPKDATYQDVEWSSSDPSVATVSDSGVVRGIKPGSVTITAATDKKKNVTADQTITVTRSANPITTIWNTIDLGVSASPSNTATTDKNGNRTSSDTSIDTVGFNEVVTADSVGAESIRAETTDESDRTDDLALSVDPAPIESISPIETTEGNEQVPDPVYVESISISGASSVYVGSTVSLNVSVSPSDATYQTVEWSTSDDSIATVDPNGVVTGIAKGTATILAKATDGSGRNDYLNIEVDPVYVEYVTVSGSSSVRVGDSVTLSASVSPMDATNKTVEWFSSDESIATVSSNGVVTGVSEGTATVWAAATDGSEQYGYMDITVSPVQVENVPSAELTGGYEQSAYWYNPFGTVQAESVPLEEVTDGYGQNTYWYDPFANVQAESLPLEEVTDGYEQNTYWYDPFGTVQAESVPLEEVTDGYGQNTYWYDPFNTVQEETIPSANVTDGNAGWYSPDSSTDTVHVYFFWGEGCPHCAEERPFLMQLKDIYGDKLEIHDYEIWFNSENAETAEQFARAYGFELSGVPVTLIGTNYIVGFSEDRKNTIDVFIAEAVENGAVDPQDVVDGIVTPPYFIGY